MPPEKDGLSTAESLIKTRTYGKFRCHNPTCMERLEPKKGDKTIKCPTCGMEFRVAWVKDGFPRCRGPVWHVNKKITTGCIFIVKMGRLRHRIGNKM